jgi:hypothetical protein
MKNYASLVIFVGFICINPGFSHGLDYSGQWLGTVTKTENSCKKDLGKAKLGDYKLTIMHKGKDLVVMENVVQRPYTGPFNSQQPGIARVHGSYVVDGGYVTESVNVEFVDDATGKGDSVWRWSNGYLACGGRFIFTLVKIKQ